MKYLVGNITEIEKTNAFIWNIHPNGMTARHDAFIGTLDNDGVEITEEYIQAVFQAPETFDQCDLDKRIQYYSNVPNYKKGALQLDPGESHPSQTYAISKETTTSGQFAIPFHNCIGEYDEDGNMAGLKGGFAISLVEINKRGELEDGSLLFPEVEE
jgi:hypothetical protein